MKITSIRSTLSPSKLKDFISFDGGRSYRELLKSHSVTMTVSELTLMEFILICERNDMIIHPSINLNPDELSFDSYRMNNITERNEKTVREYVRRCNELYKTLVNRYNVPHIEAMSVLPLSLYVNAKITVTGYGLSKSLFKYTDIHGIFTDGPAAKTYGMNRHNAKTIENLTETMMNKYLATLNSVENRKDHCMKLCEMSNFDGCAPFIYTADELYHLNWQSKEDIAMSTYISILTEEVNSASKYRGLDMRRDKTVDLTFNRRNLSTYIKDNPARKCEKETVKVITDLISIRGNLKNRLLISDLRLGVETARVYISSSLMDEVIAMGHFMGDGCGDSQTYNLFQNRYRKLIDISSPALKELIDSHIYPAVM